MVLTSYGVAAALTAGCTIVAKAAPETPIEGQLLAECAEAVGLPPGVLNVVPAGREVGDYLINRPEIDKVSFTGSVAGGKRIAEVCAKRLARYTLELGGKSPALIMDDADLGNAIGTIVPFAMPMTGQICFSLTRVLVSKKRHDEVVDAYSQAVKKIVVGDPWKAETQMGPLSMKRQLDRVLGYLEKGRKDGATLVTGGGRPKDMNRGYYVEPTIFTNVDSNMTIAKEEIFGPVVSVMPYEDEEDAIRIANNSTYGLSGAVFTKDTEKGVALARRIRTGNVSVNGLKLDNAVPFGGYKESGVGRVGGPEGLEALPGDQVGLFAGLRPIKRRSETNSPTRSYSLRLLFVGLSIRGRFIRQNVRVVVRAGIGAALLGLRKDRDARKLQTDTVIAQIATIQLT